MIYTPRQRELLHTQLESRLAELREQLGSDLSRNHQAEDLAMAADEPGDEADRSVNASNVDLSLSTAHRHADEAAQLQAAMRRLEEDGTEEAAFGQCVQCGADIPFARMLAQPTAVRCFACQSQHEKTHLAAEMPTL